MLKKSINPGLVFALCYLAAPQTHAVEKDNFLLRNAGDLAALCQTPSTDPLYKPAIHFCQGFMVGAYRYYLVMTKVPESKPFVCLPQPAPSRDEIVSQFNGWMKEHQQYNAEEAVDVLFRFAGEKYPCKS